MVLLGAALVYLSVFVQSAAVFVVGELLCAASGLLIAWRRRSDIQKWYRQRWECSKCGGRLPGMNGPCPACGHNRFQL